MQNVNTDKLEELVIEELAQVSGGRCWDEYVWADGPRFQCRRDPWNSPTYQF
jgi:hypothetical protein